MSFPQEVCFDALGLSVALVFDDEAMTRSMIACSLLRMVCAMVGPVIGVWVGTLCGSSVALDEFFCCGVFLRAFKRVVLSVLQGCCAWEGKDSS